MPASEPEATPPPAVWTESLRKNARNAAIGAIAAIITVYFPRVMASVIESDAESMDIIFDREYLWLALVFAAMIAVFVGFIAAGTDKTARDIFFMSLSAPALLAGALNTTQAASNAKSVDTHYQALAQKYQESLGVSTENDEIIEPVEEADRTGWFRLPGIGVAYAGAACPSGRVPDARGGCVSRPYYGAIKSPSLAQQYYVTLSPPTNSRTQAQNTARRLDTKIAGKAYVIKTSKGYRVVTSISPVPIGAALGEIQRIKKKGGLSPGLLRIGRTAK